MKSPKQKIQQLFTLTPARAVDVLFSQSKIDQVQNLYSSLQQNKKNNTIALKQTLQNNYQKLLYCSDILEQVRKYADSVKDVAKVIQNQMQKGVNRNQIPNNQQGLFQRIQLLVKRGKYWQAIKQSYDKQAELSRKDKYYIFYQRIEIINKMERHICLHRLDQNRLKQYAKCLQQLIFQKNKTYVKFRGTMETWMKDFSQKSLLYLLNKRIQALKTIKLQTQTTIPIFQTLFQYKLLTLKNKFKINRNATYFSQYFQELQTILKLYNNIKLSLNSSNENLHTSFSKIFHQCTAQIKSQLASIFIQRISTGQIIFKTDLYQQLVKNQSFQQIIEQFYQGLSQNGKYEVEHPLKFIKDLWHNYFINLIDLFLDQANPLIRLSSLKQHSIQHQNLPAQLKIFLHDYSLEQSVHIYVEYQQKLDMLLKNIIPIIKKCSNQQIQSFNEKFNSKVAEIIQKCIQFVHKIEEEQSLLGFRKYVLLKILIGMLKKEMMNLNYEFKIGLEAQQIFTRLKTQKPQKYWKPFQVKYAEQAVFDVLINFDSFFIGYLQGTQNVSIRAAITDALCEISLSILIYVQQTNQKQGEALTHTIESLKQRKQKVTIFDKIAVPYLAKQIFNCSMKSVSLEKQFFNKNFVSKQQIKQPIKNIEQPPADEFEIGQRQQKQQPVKANISKSIKTFGNLLTTANKFTGFMKKK